MKRALIVLAVIALVASAGDMISGGSDLTKFTGYGTFRWTSYGIEGANPENQFSDFIWMAWLPKINDSVDFCFSAAHTTTSSDINIDFDQMYLNMKVTDCLSLRGGQFKVPFGYAYTRSGGSMLFADRSFMLVSTEDPDPDSPPGTMINDFFTYGGRDIGAMLTVEFAPVTVDLMLSNGTGNNAAADTSINKQFTARLAVEPTEWLTIGGSMAMIGQPEMGDDESVSSNGMDFFAVANYPVTPTGTLNFVGEYMMLDVPVNDIEGVELHNGARMSVMAGYDMQLDGDVIMAIQPAVRYDSVDPITGWEEEGGEEPEDNLSAIDFCVGIDLFSNLNTLQIGARNYGFENSDIDGYTDIYANWRMNF
ncbi:MAG: hypothetical protein K8S62_12285 [Candidatus Sabulitectum sp.]|nr:hypothetical protein [Candidatus Sabulitectum sp.]